MRCVIIIQGVMPIPKVTGEKRCALCGTDSPSISSYLGLCGRCIRGSEEALPMARLAHRSLRKRLGLPPQPPKSSDGLSCNLCSNECRMAPGERGYCGLRLNERGAIVTIAPRGNGLFYDYIDPHVTNCCSAWFCPAGTGAGYPRFANRPGPEIGYHNLAIFFYGCNFDCLYCLLPRTAVVTNRGIFSIEEMFNMCEHVETINGGEISYPSNIQIITHNGRFSQVLKVFRHFYEGEIVAIRPKYLPPLECSPSHKIFVTNNTNVDEVKTVLASDLDEHQFVVMPHYNSLQFPIVEEIDVRQSLSYHQPIYKKPGRLSIPIANKILSMANDGSTSRQIALQVGYHPTYLRRLLPKLKRSNDLNDILHYAGVPVVENGMIRLKKEKRPGIPHILHLSEEFAELLGYFVAEGNVCKDKKRPASYRIVFSFGHSEEGLVKRTEWLLWQLFALRGSIVKRRTTITVEVGKSSLALLFYTLCGGHAGEKTVPNEIYLAKTRVMKAFIEGYFKGDGCKTEAYYVCSTTSRRLALGISWLLLRLGALPHFYEYKPSATKDIEGRIVKQSTIYIVKIKELDFDRCILYKEEGNERKLDDSSYIYIPIKKLTKRPYAGYVYNLEVEDEGHSYIANFIGVGNCQNESHKDLALGHHKPVEHLIERVGGNSAISCICFFGGSPEPQLPFAISTSKRLLKAYPDRVMRICFEWNGCGNSELVREAANLSLISGGNLKFDLKCFSEATSIALSGVSNRRAFDNFEAIARDFHPRRPELPLLTATTLLVPGYVDEYEVGHIAEFISRIDRSIPYSLLIFHPDFMMRDMPITPLEQTAKCYIAAKAFLERVHVGNLDLLGIPGMDEFLSRL